jgi:TonB family protein
MAQSAVVETSSWQGWERRVVGGRFALLECLKCSEEWAIYLTEMNGATALLKLLRADAPNAGAQVAGWELASQFSHPNLVRILELGIWHADEDLDMHFAVMEYCEESLAEVLCARQLTSDEACTMLMSLLDALQYLHQHGVAHGHLNPANILARGNQLKLTTDELGRIGDAGQLSAPGAYDPPETVFRRGTFRADIWSLGLTLSEALTNRLPQLGKDGRPQFAEVLPVPFDAIVKQCVTIDCDSQVSLQSIRNLLDRPLDDESAPILPTDPTCVDDCMARPIVLHAGEKPRTRWTNRRTKVIAASTCLLLLTILVWVGVAKRGTNTPSAPSPSQIGTAASIENPGTVRHDSLPLTKAGTVVHEVLPEIPSKARNTIRGTVKAKVQVTLDAQSRVISASLARNSSSAYFGRQALQAARQWSFSAPVRDGRAQAAEWIIKFEFRRGGTRATAQQYSLAR